MRSRTGRDAVSLIDLPSTSAICHLLGRREDLLCVHLVVLYLNDRLPSKPGRILHHHQLGARGTVEDRVQPVISLEPLSRQVLVEGERDLSDAGPFSGGALDECLRLGVCRREIRSKPRFASTLLHPSHAPLVLHRDLDGNPLDLGVTDHRPKLGCARSQMRRTQADERDLVMVACRSISSSRRRASRR